MIQFPVLRWGTRAPLSLALPLGLSGVALGSGAVVDEVDAAVAGAAGAAAGATMRGHPNAWSARPPLVALGLVGRG